MKIRDKEYYRVEFVEKQRSPNDIAKEWDTYPNKIRREIVNHGYKLRNKSEAQSVALKQGRHRHPTKGTKRKDEVKEKISDSLAKAWDKTSDEERERRAELARVQWNAMSDDDRNRLQQLAADAVRDTIKEGSKLEKFLIENLPAVGFPTEFHRDNLIPGQKLQVDLYIPSISTIIEIDGPSHFFPIWGEETLAKTMSSDAKKNALLLYYGFVIIRVKHLAKNISDSYKRKLFSVILDIVKDIEMKFPEENKRFIEVELN